MGQLWIKSDNTYLSVLVQGVTNGRPILLLPGFAEPKSDLAYWLTYLSNYLENLGKFYVMQADLTGSGNSSGDISEISLEKLLADIETLINYLAKITGRKVTIVARGLSAALCYTLYENELIEKCIGVNPFICGETERKRVIEKEDYLQIYDDNENKYIKSILRFMGTEITNIEGEKISVQFFKAVSNYNWYDIYKSMNSKNKIIYLNSNSIFSYCNKEEYLTKSYLLAGYEEQSLIDDGEVLGNLIQMIKSEIMK